MARARNWSSPVPISRPLTTRVAGSWPRFCGAVALGLACILSSPVVSAQSESTAADGTGPEPAQPANLAPSRQPEHTPPVDAADSIAHTPSVSVPSDHRLLPDQLRYAGHVSGYRRFTPLGTTPYRPPYPLPSNVSIPYHGPIKSDDWVFQVSGYISAALRFSFDRRQKPNDHQTAVMTHVDPSVVEEWATFTSTASVPGSSGDLQLSYGNKHVTAHVRAWTWRPMQGTSFFELGPMAFLRDAYVSVRPNPILGVRIHAKVGMYGDTYGALGKYGNGLYSNPLIANIRGIGETLTLEYNLSDGVVMALEHGFMGNLNGWVPRDVAPDGGNRFNPANPASFTNHLHLAFSNRTEPALRLALHFVDNWSQDDRNFLPYDNRDTRAFNEMEPTDGRVRVFGFDARMDHRVYGYLAFGMAYIQGRDSFFLEDVETYGGHGRHLSDRWYGDVSGGNGEMLVGAINYGFSVGKIINPSFPGDGPDILVNAGLHMATTLNTVAEPFDGRFRHKYALDVEYVWLPWLSLAGRVDRVVPNSKDPEETFHVLAPRLVFRTAWQTHEYIALRYAKWFYGPRTRIEGTGERSISRLDSHMLALDFGIYF